MHQPGIFNERDRKTATQDISNSCGYEEIDLIEIACEAFNFDLAFDQEKCIMNKRTAINDTNFVISDLEDEDITGIEFDSNKKIEYLPYKIYMQFPNMISYSADSCSIKQISKYNFEKLHRLNTILLESNKIQKISGNTFKGLTSLIFINLSKFFVLHTRIRMYKTDANNFKFCR